MTPERWRQIEALYQSASERTPAEREDFLAGVDPELRREVESLLAQDSNALGITRTLPEAPAARVSPGSLLGPYRIEERIGAGGMGEVFRGVDTRLDRPVAIKISHEKFSERFEREARAISALNHPHICTLYDIGSQDGVSYVVMEYVEGKPLHGPLKIADALRLSIQIAGALQAAHEKGILHRDLKPGNILVTKAGVKLLDFGLAKIMRGEPRHSDVTVTQPLTVTGQILGTPAYMSPEQIEGKPVDARSDIFSLGLVIYEMLAGRRAFQADSQNGIMAAILREDPPPLVTLQPKTPAALDRTVRKCLAKDPAERWQTVADLRHELEWIASGDSPVARTMAILAAGSCLADEKVTVCLSPGNNAAAIQSAETLASRMFRQAGLRRRFHDLPDSL